MLRTVGAKLIRLLPVLFLVSLGTFFMLELVPGDPALSVLGPDALPEQYEAVRKELGLDKPLVERYVSWLGDALRGDLGSSLRPPVQEVADAVKQRLPVTAQLTLLSTLMALAVALPCALACAYRAGERFDRATNAIAFAALSVPGFVAGLLIVFFFVFHTDVVRWLVLGATSATALWLAWRTVADRDDAPTKRFLVSAGVLAVGLLLFFAFPDFPRQGFVRLTAEEGVLENLRSAFLPSLTLAVVEMAVFIRLLRSDLITTLFEDYILAARAKGLPARKVLTRHALRPSLFSLITVGALTIGRTIGGTAIVETIFGLPGMGTLLTASITGRDYKVVQGGVLVIAVFFVLLNALVDIAYAYIDPRIRRRG